MSFIGLFQKLKKKGSSEGSGQSSKAAPKRRIPSSRNLQFDLFAQLSYMSAVATAGISRRDLFALAASLPYATAKYFADINALARKLNIDYAESCRMVADRAETPEVGSLLMRMAGSLAAGEAEDDFLRREAEIIGETFGNQYERDVEALKKWADAYVTLLVASGLIVIVAVMSMMIYPVGVALIVGLAGLMVGATCLGAWIIYASAPREITTRLSGPSSKLQLQAASIFRITAPLTMAVAAVLFLMRVDLGWILIISAILLAPAGWLIKRDDKRLAKKDADIASTVRVLGGVTSALGTTVSEAITNIDLRSMGALMPEVTRLKYRLGAGLDPDLCWKALVNETGSELIDRTIEMFHTALSLGGDAAKIGQASSFFASKIAFLRATRGMVASSFRWLTLPLHVAMVGLLEFIVEIMNLFSLSIAQSALGLAESMKGSSASIGSGQLITFGVVDMQMVHILVTTVVLVLTAANAYAGVQALLLYHPLVGAPDQPPLVGVQEVPGRHTVVPARIAGEAWWGVSARRKRSQGTDVAKVREPTADDIRKPSD